MAHVEPDPATVDPILRQLPTGVALFEQLRQLDTGSAVLRAVNEALSVDELRALALFQVFTWRQQADDSDTYAAWSAT
jgi:hypothetical protein